MNVQCGSLLSCMVVLDLMSVPNLEMHMVREDTSGTDGKRYQRLLQRIYTTAYRTSQTYHTLASTEMWTHTPLSGTRVLMTTENNY